MVDEQAVLHFLMGSGPLDGLYFSDLVEGRDFWWRPQVKRVFDQIIAERDAALSRAEQAEAALAEERKAMDTASANYAEQSLEVMSLQQDLADERKKYQAFREEVSEAVGNAETVGDLFHFILPAKPADPLVEKIGYGEIITSGGRLNVDALLAAIERAGGVKAVFGEESDYDSLPKCIKDTEFTAGRRAGGTISFEGEG